MEHNQHDESYAFVLLNMFLFCFLENRKKKHGTWKHVCPQLELVSTIKCDGQTDGQTDDARVIPLCQPPYASYAHEKSVG